MIALSLVVCTRNRCDVLAEAAEAWQDLQATFDWELVLVDNASTDPTPRVAQAIVERLGDRARYEREPSLGLSAARNLGVRLARGERIAFLDDDAFPSGDWLDATASALDQPGVLAMGGPVEPEFDAALPAWFGPGFLPYVSAWDRGPERHDLEYNEFPRGTNMAFRRSAFERVGDFDLQLGRRGRSLRSCEEIELCLRIARAGGRVVYEPAARVRHRVAASRLTPEWMVQRFRAQGLSEAILEWKHFGWTGLRAGLRRAEATHARSLTAAGREALATSCHRAALAAYRFGAAYALLATPRWQPPRGSARTGSET